jgi:hypothetical protein
MKMALQLAKKDVKKLAEKLVDFYGEKEWEQSLEALKLIKLADAKQEGYTVCFTFAPYFFDEDGGFNNVDVIIHKKKNSCPTCYQESGWVEVEGEANMIKKLIEWSKRKGRNVCAHDFTASMFIESLLEDDSPTLRWLCMVK